MSLPQLIRCMHAATVAEARGGIAAVHWLPDIPVEQFDEAAAGILAQDSQPADTLVLVGGSAGHYSAESYGPTGRPIQFCGHGALAAAFVVLDQYEQDAETLQFVNRRQSWQARRAELPTADIALSYVCPDPVVQPVPQFSAACLGSTPVAAANVGADADYLILELNDAAAVQAVQPDFAVLSQATQRACIVTARAADTEAPGCVFRYFAPQYGNPEDAATGSAAVQLAAYWASRLGVDTFTAYQLSAQGAHMHLSCHAGTVELAARVGYG